MAKTLPVATVTVDMVGFNPILKDPEALVNVVVSALAAYRSGDGTKPLENISFFVSKEDK